MRTIIAALAALPSLVLVFLACSSEAPKEVAAWPTPCMHNYDCPQSTIINTQCGITSCVEGKCIPGPVDAGQACIVGFFDNDASAPIWGACNGQNTCCNDAGCAP